MPLDKTIYDISTHLQTVNYECSSVQVGNFSTRFSLQSFIKRVDKLTDDQKTALDRLGFGNLLQIPYQMLCKNLLAELTERWSCEKHAFLLLPGEMSITLMDVALILGLRVTGDPVILREDEPFSDLEREYSAAIWNRKITIASIEERLDSIGGIVNEDFIRSFLLFILGTLLFPNANGKLDSRYLSLLQRLDKVCNFAWGAAVLEDLTNWLCKRKEMNIQYVGGCRFLLQIWSYEHIDIARPILVDCPMKFPRACRWGTSRSHHRKWFTSKFKELEKNQIMWKLQLTSEESKMDTLKELLEAQSGGKELPNLRYNVIVDKVDNARTRLQIMDQWIAELQNESEMELENESEMDIIREVHGAQEDCSKQLRTAQNVPVVLTDEDILSTSYDVSEVRREHMEQPWASQDSSAIIIISDDDDEDNLETNGHILEEQNMKLKMEIDDIRKENKLLKDQLLSRATFEEQNVKLRKEVENLRQENELLVFSADSLVARLERLIFDENLNGTEQSSAS